MVDRPNPLPKLFILDNRNNSAHQVFDDNGIVRPFSMACNLPNPLTEHITSYLEPVASIPTGYKQCPHCW